MLMPQEKPRIFTRNFGLLFAANILIIVTYVMLCATMAYYAVLSFAVSDALGGIASSSFLIASMIARVLCGRFGERFGLKRVTIASCGVIVVASALYLVSASSFALLIATRILHGLAFGIAATSIPSLIAKTLEPEVAGVGTGYFMLSNTLGTAIGPWLGLILANGAHYDVEYVLSLVCAIAAFAFSLFIADDKATAPSAAIDSEHAQTTPCIPNRPKGLAAFIDPGTVVFGLFVLLSAFAYSGFSTFLNGYSVEIALEHVAPYAFLLYAATNLLSRPLAGKLMDARGENAVLIPSALLGAAGFVILALAHNAFGMLAVGMLMALGFGTTISAGAGILARDSRDDRTTLRMSTYYLLIDGGIGVGPVFLGLAIDMLGYQNMYLLCAAVALVSLVAYYFMHGRAHRR